MDANSDGPSNGSSNGSYNGSPCTLAPTADRAVESVDAHAHWSRLRWPEGVRVRPAEKRLRGYLIKVLLL
jgi:hypothetical protein